MSARRPAMCRLLPPPSGIGDLRLIGKLRVLDNEAGGFGLAFVPQIGFPTGSDTAFRGDGTLSIESRIGGRLSPGCSGHRRQTLDRTEPLIIRPHLQPPKSTSAWSASPISCALVGGRRQRGTTGDAAG